MRDILFRGKLKDKDDSLLVGGSWACGSLVHQTEFYGDLVDKYHILYTGEFHCDYYDSVEVIPETVGQWTGRYDKNGNRIFEGDIVKARMDYGPGGWPERVVSIGWHNERGYQWEYFIMGTVEVIGNIYDNPELLKGE